VTFKDLKKRISVETTGQYRLFERLRNRPFWIWDLEKNRKTLGKLVNAALTIS
jgi:hypothetical protein